MKRLDTSIALNLTGNLANVAKRFSSSLTALSKNSSTTLSKMSTMARWSSDQLGNLANRYTGTISAIAGVGAIRSTARLEERLERLGIVAGKTKEEMQDLNAKIYQTSQSRDINIDPEELTSAVEKMAAMTGDIDFAEKNLANLARALSATGAAGEDIGSMVGNMFQKFDIKTSDEILQVLDIFANQANEGSFELKDLATQGERIMAAYATLGRSGSVANREMGALMQTARMGTGSAEQAATAFEAMTRTFTDPAKIKLLERSGIALKDNAGNMRSVTDIMKDIIMITGGDATELKKVFDTFAFRGVSTLAIEYQTMQKAGKAAKDSFPSLDKFYSVQSTGETIIRDSQRMAIIANSSWRTLVTGIKQFSHKTFSKDIARFSQAVNSLEPERLQQYLEITKKIVIALASVWAVGKTINLGKSAITNGTRFINFLTGKKGGKMVGAAGLISGATPVYVVNMGAGGLAGGLGDMTGVGKIAGAGLLGKGLLLAGIGVAAYYVGDTIGQGIAGVVAGEYEDAGEKFGTLIGGGLGAVFGPVGILIGSQFGKTAGGWLGRWFQDVKKENEIAEKERAERIRKFNQEKQQTVILKNENSFKIISDEKGVRVVDAAPNNMTKIPLKLDTGYTAYVR